MIERERERERAETLGKRVGKRSSEIDCMCVREGVR